jgi:addiction module RelE/StbE family toxin
MLALEWREAAFADLKTIVDYIAGDNPEAASALQEEIEIKIEKLRYTPRLYKLGRVPGTREMVVQGNFVVVYTENSRTVSILRVLHAARQWP